MKIVRRLLFICCTILSFVAKGQIQNVDTLIHRAFNALKNDDEKAFMVVVPDYVQMRSILDSGIEKIKDTSTRRQIAEGLASLTQSMFDSTIRANVHRSFQSIRLQATEKGMDWNTAEILSTIHEESTTPLLEIKTIEGVINLKDAKDSFQLLFSEAVWSPAERGWFGITFTKLLKRGENWDASKDEKIEDVQIEITSEETPPPPPPPPPKAGTKSKTKTKASKPKVKS
jgi:hypothetical protein